MDLLIPLALAALLIFFLFNSRRKQKARAEQIKSGLVPGASVMTTFGVFGTVLAIDEESNQVTLESGPGTVLRVHRQAIGQVDSGDAAAPGAVADAPVTDVTSADAADIDADKPAITDAELDAMNARRRAEGAEEIDPATSQDDSDVTAGEKPGAEAADASAGSETADDAGAEAADAGSSTDADSDSSDSASTDTDKKN